MKQIMLTASAVLLSTSAMSADFYVGAERETHAGNNIAFVGVEQSVGNLTLKAQPEFGLNQDPNGKRGEVSKVNLDAAYSLNKKLDVYLENDLNENFKRTETKVGMKYKF